MSEITRLNEKELLDLGMSRVNIAALRNMQQITGATLVDPTEIGEVIAILLNTISTIRSQGSALQKQIDELKVASLNRIPEKNNKVEELEVQINKRRPVLQVSELLPVRSINLYSIQQQIDEIKTHLGI
jgi:hypothetical protein